MTLSSKKAAPDTSTRGGRIKHAMHRKGLSQASLARALSISRASMSNLINGKTQQPKSENLIKLAEALGVSDKWLLYGEKEPDLSKMPAPEKSSLRGFMKVISELDDRDLDLLYTMAKRLRSG